MSKKNCLVTIVGARPQFIKTAILSKAIQVYNKRKPGCRVDEILVHTGQHYDSEMSQVFFEQLEISPPHYHLGVGSGRHGEQTARMLTHIESILLKEGPNLVVVFGDTNSTLAGALAAAKLGIPIAHIEAGLRGHNHRTPEEINRMLTDRISDLLFCPTESSILNLKKEGITQGIHWVGDVMLDVFLRSKSLAIKKSGILRTLGLTSGSYCLATVHRQENTDDPIRLQNIFASFSRLATKDCPFIVPLHPRTRKALNDLAPRNAWSPNIHFLRPVGYLDMVALEAQAKMILTDSGGVQREAFFCRIPCITLRDETEWTETVESGWNFIAGTETPDVIRAFEIMSTVDLSAPPAYFGNGRASEQIVNVIAGFIHKKRR
jgi:UDP-N-acetylglucosamine 2-epimerase